MTPLSVRGNEFCELTYKIHAITLKKLISYILDFFPPTYKRGDSFWPLGDDGKLICEDTDYVDTWKVG